MAGAPFAVGEGQSTTQSSAEAAPEADERRRAAIARIRAANERPEPAADRLVPAPVMGVSSLLRGRAPGVGNARNLRLWQKQVPVLRPPMH